LDFEEEREGLLALREVIDEEENGGHDQTGRVVAAFRCTPPK
jgi:hypothetical protein